MLDVKVQGIEQVLGALGQIQQGAEMVGNAELIVASDLKYAYGIETGRTPRGRLARRIGGAYMFRSGVDAGLRGFEAAVAAALPDGGPAVARVYLAAGRRTVDEVQRRTPVVTGRLRGSVQMRLKVDR